MVSLLICSAGSSPWRSSFSIDLCLIAVFVTPLETKFKVFVFLKKLLYDLTVFVSIKFLSKIDTKSISGSKIFINFAVSLLYSTKPPAVLCFNIIICSFAFSVKFSIMSKETMFVLLIISCLTLSSIFAS